MSEDEIIEHAIRILEYRLRQPRQTLSCSIDTKRYLSLQFSNQEYESFRVMFLDSQNGLIETNELFRGTIDSAHIYPREVLKAALAFNAKSVILAHNHPSGCTEPSRQDIAITECLKKALELVDIRTLDHLVVGNSEICSFAERGLL